MTGFVCVIEVELRFRDVHDLKGKRKLVKSLKDGLRNRVGASVAETGGHDKWQRATLLCSLTGDADVASRADALERFVESRCPEVSFTRRIRSLEDLDA